jgi:hypothetical protein
VEEAAQSKLARDTLQDLTSADEWYFAIELGAELEYFEELDRQM